MATEIRISGSGGQGVVLAGIILAEASGIYEGREVIHMQDYGGAMRGGAVRSEVLIADPGAEIVYPAATNADLLVAMTQEAADRWVKWVKETGMIIYDSTYVRKPPSSTATAYHLPITAALEEKLGTKLGANIVALGVVCKLAHVVSEEALERAMLQRIPPGTESFNKDALRLGFEIAQDLS
jgi:2-oxoglutarate ferredoxin oxidoreductase subunit gamma